MNDYELSKLYFWTKDLQPINPSGKKIRNISPIINKTHFRYDFNNPLDFLDVFDINKSELYKENNNEIYTDYIYRGHKDSEWLLRPSGFRDIQDKKGTYLSGNGQYSGEADNFIQFIKGIDSLSYNVEKDSYSLIKFLNKREKISGVNSDGFGEYLSFPKESQLGELALAQHYGVKTRLLDFTENPMTALFFASESLFPNNHIEEGKKIGIWVIPKLLIDAIKYLRFIKYVDVKKYQNKYITAQKGVFIHYFPSTKEAISVSENIEKDNLLDISYTLDSLLTADYPNEYLKKIMKEHIGKPMLFTLPQSELFPIAKRLNQLNINWITMMPSLDGVKKEVERQNIAPFSKIT